MFRKSTILSLAAAATFGVLAISTTSASAFHFGGARAGGVHFSAARVAGPHVSFNRNFAFRRIVKLYPPHHHWHWRWHHFGWRPYWVAPIAAAGVATTYAATPTCNCLTKQYTQDGAVVFKDLCTNEMAMNPPAADSAPQAPASYVPPQQPMQQGYLQPQPMQ